MYEIYAYGDNDSLFGIFNAIAAISASDSYVGAVAIVVVCGFITAAIAYALAPERLVGWKWLGSVLLVYTILLVPKVTVGIVDKLGTQPVQVIGNVPFGAAIFGHLTSVVGNALTEVFETAFQVLPGPGQLSADLSYQKHGLMFGNSLIKRSREATFPDPNFRTDLVNYIANCTMYDLADGSIDPAVFARSTNLWADMANPNPARFSTITTGGTTQISPCPAVYANLDARRAPIEAQLYNTLASQLNPYLPASQAQANAANEIVAAYQLTLLANASASAADIIRQNGVINAINDASEIIGQKANDPASLLLAFGRAQATAQTNAAWMNFAKMAEDALPLIRNAIEAITYALFPILILLLLLTHGMGTMRVLLGYLFTLVWIQLWPVVYAILHYMSSIASARHIAAAAELGGGGTGLALLTASQVYSTVISDQAVVGYLVLSVPAIAWAAVKGMEAIGQAAITGVSSLQSMAGSASGAAATGNLSAGNVAFEQQQLAPMRSAAAMRKFSSIHGTESTDRVTGENRYEYLLGSNPLGMHDSQQIAQDASQASTNLAATARASLRSSETSMSAALSEAQGLVRASGRSQAARRSDESRHVGLRHGFGAGPARRGREPGARARHQRCIGRRLGAHRPARRNAAQGLEPDHWRGRERGQSTHREPDPGGGEQRRAVAAREGALAPGAGADELHELRRVPHAAPIAPGGCAPPGIGLPGLQGDAQHVFERAARGRAVPGSGASGGGVREDLYLERCRALQRVPQGTRPSRVDRSRHHHRRLQGLPHVGRHRRGRQGERVLGALRRDGTDSSPGFAPTRTEPLSATIRPFRQTRRTMRCPLTT